MKKIDTRWERDAWIAFAAGSMASGNNPSYEAAAKDADAMLERLRERLTETALRWEHAE